MKDGIKKKNFILDFELMRVGAENERQNQFKELRDISVKKYYEIC